jgi:hypothetical protein
MPSAGRPGRPAAARQADEETRRSPRRAARRAARASARIVLAEPQLAPQPPVQRLVEQAEAGHAASVQAHESRRSTCDHSCARQYRSSRGSAPAAQARRQEDHRRRQVNVNGRSMRALASRATRAPGRPADGEEGGADRVGGGPPRRGRPARGGAGRGATWATRAADAAA